MTLLSYIILLLLIRKGKRNGLATLFISSGDEGGQATLPHHIVSFSENEGEGGQGYLPSPCLSCPRCPLLLEEGSKMKEGGHVLPCPSFSHDGRNTKDL